MLAELLQKPMSKADFIDRFAPAFPAWNGQCGIIGLSGLIDICRELGLATGAESFRGRVKVRELAENGKTRGVFVLTERVQGQNGDWGDLFHIQLLRGFYADRWLLWHPN